MKPTKTMWGTMSDLKPVAKAVTVRQPMGHTAYHHVGALGASPYFQFAGMRQRYPGPSWNAGYGGVVATTRSAQAAQARGLGANEIPNLLEMTLGPDTIHTPAFRRTSLHQRFPRHEALFGTCMAEMGGCMAELGDWPLVYQKGPESEDPNGDGYTPYIVSPAVISLDRPALGGVLDLSDNEKLLALAGAAALGWWLWKRSKKGRRNPSRARYAVYARQGKRGPLSYAMSFASKASAQTYASSLRRSGSAAQVRRT